MTILATNNSGKAREMREILAAYKIKTLEQAGMEIDVIEDKDTFYGNALKKASEIYEIIQEPVIADDSGLCIEALNQWPGVLTHRFLGENRTDRERNEAMIERLNNVSDRSAKVVCVLVYYDGKNTIIGNGVIEGSIAHSPRGDNGFGFDEIFELPNGNTLAELDPLEKNKISARYLAAQDLKQKLEKIAD
ncbi:MAG: RdgB/HAM1 family non-canonical purine NTP pyrophosphatase [Candidatus Sacchiramonaceae bacterium]|nr:RdgB/HAM1 family non-canonical purine NTP pyrophosphatase [Candidatus Saccharimonadaceae bacterium]